MAKPTTRTDGAARATVVFTEGSGSYEPLPRLTRKVFTDLSIWMTGLGLLMGPVFPFFVMVFGVPSTYVLSAKFFFATIGAGLVVGATNYFLSRAVVGSRQRFMCSRMSKVESTLRDATLDDDEAECTPEKCMITVDSDDELGDAADSFNQLVEALAESQRASRVAGLTPWCLGIESQAATGWVATDWTEDLVLRLAGPDTYDALVRGDVGFADPAIADAFARFRELALVPGRPTDGVSGVLRTSHLVCPLALFGDSPECVLHRQASFVINSMPPGLEFGPDGDIDFFVFPGVGSDAAAPLLVGSVVAVSFDDRPQVAAVMTHLATPSSTRRWAEAGGFLRPHNTVDVDELAPVDRAPTELIRDADIIRADASDAMPPDIGTGLLWQEITSWIAEEVTYDQLATTIDSARDSPS